MAYIDTVLLEDGDGYALGEYEFHLERTSVPGSSNDKIEAICTKDGHNARKSIQIPSSTQLEGWYVEANETEVSVYVITSLSYDDLHPNCEPPITVLSGGISTNERRSDSAIISASADMPFIPYSTTNDRFGAMKFQADQPFTVTVTYMRKNGQTGTWTGQSSVGPTYYGKTVYFAQWGVTDGTPVQPHYTYYPNGDSSWIAVYGNEFGENKERLVARFAIDLADAGGVGPGGGTGGGWTDPGDYDEDWEEGDPTHTLYVEATGALSGRHNDPIVDPSYSYIPDDKGTVKDYGCGGDGGHGGGGGAGASTVVIHKFATNQANSKEVTAIARRHGYGSGGGKGGKGGDGCILVYY